MKNNPEQPRLIAEEGEAYQASPEEEQQKEIYRKRLKEALQDPEFRNIPGFPIGTDEAILELSDPPYYTACPNPFMTEIIEEWQKERQEIRQQLGLPDETVEGNGYHREPFAADVSEGKNNPIYNAHSYHTKVPHPAIMRYILHYTDPGDIVFDGFCGTGMTGVAASFCGERKEVEKLGYYIDDEFNIFDNANKKNKISHIGKRKSILNDLSPAATFIAYNYTNDINGNSFHFIFKNNIEELEKELSWMYDTLHTGWSIKEKDQRKWNNKDINSASVKGRIEYTIWSDIFVCPECGDELILWEIAVDLVNGAFFEKIYCPNCKAEITENDLERKWEKVFDPGLQKIVDRAKQKPVLINYSLGKKRFEKKPDELDLEKIKKIENSNFVYWLPVDKLPEGDNTGQPIGSHGANHVHQYFNIRTNHILSKFWELSKNKNLTEDITKRIQFIATASMLKLSRRIIFSPARKGGGTVATVALYFPSLSWEKNAIEFLKRKFKAISKTININLSSRNSNNIISTQSSSLFNIPSSSIDYIFIDPPFGGNLMYSELNFLWESWIKVKTNNIQESIVNKHQQKQLSDYQQLMELCLKEFYRILKPNHWLTIEFHNTKNQVWTSIQEATLKSGFVIADVRVLDKKQSSFKQETSISIAKKDLIISCYKPSKDLEDKITSIYEINSIDRCWDFISQHLEKLPVKVFSNEHLQSVAERKTYLLYDRMVAFFIQRGFQVPISAGDFYLGLEEKFPKRDGMYFLPEQVIIYDKARIETETLDQTIMYIKDEKTAIQFIRQLLGSEYGGKPLSYKELQPIFIKELHQAKYEAFPELQEILDQNFLQDENGKWYVPDPNKASDLEKLRNKALLREFSHYLKDKKRLRQFRTEAVRAGFADAWQRKDFQTIIQVAERLPEQVLQEDPDLLMYYDNASLRID
jgi:16S rRNA G966 N2-methylase RsmD/predicted RNA-binding Zn-ribbon protein involved in translation (DUF1610 family)